MVATAIAKVVTQRRIIPDHMNYSLVCNMMPSGCAAPIQPVTSDRELLADAKTLDRRLVDRDAQARSGGE